MILTEEEIKNQAIASYLEHAQQGGYFIAENFEEDYGRFLTILRSLRRINKKKDIDFQFIKNNFVITKNQFGVTCIPVLVYFAYTRYMDTLHNVGSLLYFFNSLPDTKKIDAFGRIVHFKQLNDEFLRRLSS